MDCKEVHDKLELLLDGELGEAEKQEIFDHIKVCQQCDCQSKYEQERCFKEYLQKALYPRQLPPAIVDDIKVYIGNYA